MRYKVGDKVRVRGDLGIGKVYDGITFRKEMGEKCIFEVVGVDEEKNCIVAKNEYCLTFSSEMLRPAEFKIWCETEEEKQAVLEELEKEGYVWIYCNKKPTEFISAAFLNRNSVGLFAKENEITWDDDKNFFANEKEVELTPSEFTGINFSEKIIITKTPTGATATYGDKTVTTEGEFEDASRQALAEVLCPFKMGDKVKAKYDDVIGVVDSFGVDVRVKVKVVEADKSRGWWMAESLEPYTEPVYNAKLFCIKDGMGCFKKGHIYEMKDGKFIDSSCDMLRFGSLEEINSKSIAQFMEVLDD